MPLPFIVISSVTSMLLFGGTSSALLQAESIWARRSDDHALLFYDTRARRVGDIVTILITQQTDVDSRENRGMAKQSQAGSTFDFDAETGGGLGTQAANAAFDFGTSSNREFDGRSNYRSAQDFSDRVSVTVVDVLPNGNLVLAGVRDVQVAGEARTLTVSGVIRPIDLSPDNTVNSRFIADFRLSYEGVGAGQSFTRQGWLGRKVNRLWPF